MRTVAIDAGQSHTEVRFRGSGVERTTRGPGLGRWITDEGAAERVGHDLAEVASRAAGPDAVDRVLVGYSGLDRGGRLAPVVAGAIGAAAGAHEVVVASDALTWYLAALGRAPGVVAAVGTGTTVLASDGGSTWSGVDGWGHLLGDEGSAFAVGRAGLMSAVRSYDGRDGSAMLLRLLVERYGSVDRLAAGVYSSTSPGSLVAGFATSVAAAAADGDRDSAEIVDEAGGAIGAAILAAYRPAVPDRRAVPVVLGGSLPRAIPRLAASVRASVQAREPQLEVRIADPGPMDGVLRLAGGIDGLPATLAARWRASGP